MSGREHLIVKNMLWYSYLKMPLVTLGKKLPMTKTKKFLVYTMIYTGVAPHGMEAKILNKI